MQRDRDRLISGNGWGGKYPSPLDDAVWRKLLAASASILRARAACDDPWKGGAIDVDGAGLLVTTEQCLLNPNRNPLHDPATMMEAQLRHDLGIERDAVAG